MTAFQLYFQLKSCLLNLPPEKTFFVSEGIFLESVYFFCPYLNWYLKNVQANQLQTSDETEIKHLEELELKFNIRQKTQQKIILQTLDLLAFLLLELGRPDLTMFLMENEELNGNWSKKLDQVHEAWIFLKKATSFLLRDLKVLGISSKRLHEKFGVFQFLISHLGSNMKKKKFNCSTRPASLCGTSYISTTEDRATTSCTSKHSENLNPFHQREAQKTFKKTKDLEPSQDWANIGAYRLAYLQSQNDQLLRRLENVSSPFSPYPPYPVYKSKEYGSPLLSSFKKKRHALERTLYQVYPILIQALHCLDVYSPILSNHSSQSTQEALKNLKQPLSQAIFQCMKYDYETGGLDHEETNVQSLLNVEVCIQEVTKGCTISPQFHEKLKKSLTDRFNKLNSQMDLLRLENQAYKEEREHLCQTVTKETEVFQSEVSKVQDFQKKTQTQLSSISYEMSGLLKQMEQLKLNYSNEDALTMLQVIETLLQRWEPELDELAHLPYVPAIPTTIHSSESSETMQ